MRLIRTCQGLFYEHFAAAYDIETCGECVHILSGGENCYLTSAEVIDCACALGIGVGGDGCQGRLAVGNDSVGVPACVGHE